MERIFALKTGNVVCRETGNRIDVLIRIRNDGAGLYHGWLRGEGGCIQLGTLIPEGNDLVLHRYLELARLKASGCWPITGGGVTLTHSFSALQSASQSQLPGWVREKNPGRFFQKDSILRDSAAAMEECLLRRKEKGFLLAIPFGTGRSFPLVPIFCFSRIRRMYGGWYVVFQFQDNGMPQMPDQTDSPAAGS